MIERTKKQWHRYFVEEIAKIVSEYIDKDSDVFVECGVKQGSSSVRMGNHLKVNGYLFDTWHGFPSFSDMDVSSDKSKRRMEQRIKNGSNTYQDCITNLTKNSRIDLYAMIRGDILKTVPEFVKDLKDFNIVMMHIDTDLYEPAKISLKSFWPYMKEGGVVYFHDYGDKKWRGIKKVVDKLVESDKDLYFYIFDIEKLFSAFIVKGKDKVSKNIFNNIVNLDI